MDQTATRQAQGLTDAFNHFNRVSEQLTTSYQLLERHLADITRRFASDGHESTAADAGAQPRSVHPLQPILDALPAGVVVLDGDGRIVQCNQAALDLLGAPLAGASWFEVIQRSFADQSRLGDLRLKDGRLVALATNPLGGEPGQVILINEVTESRAMLAFVQRHQRLATMGDMASALAHQIRTPLAASLLYVSQLEDCGPTSPAQRRGIGKIRACLDHLDKLVRDMLMFARGGCFSAEKFSAVSLIEAFRQLSAPLVHDSGCRLEVIDDSGDAQLRGNPDTLVAVLQNILENAIQACRGDGNARSTAVRGGQISFVARRLADPQSIEFLLKDDGPGIAPEVRGRVLEPFFTTKPQGTGLGLAVAQAVVHAHDGVLWIESETAGTTVGIRLPLAVMPGGRQ
jgi:two-component system sensor histidine kinase FlrB